jgi:outer membrane receptor for ferrienterochelin and colicins
MTPGDITMMLNETSGLRVATTSPSLGAASVRIQGLRGRYTLMLADGLPLYGAQGSGFGLLQIPPLDLARVEVIKGTASALYGSAALGGVINLISRRPSEATLSELLVNQTSRGGTDAVFFASGPVARSGASMLVSAHRQTKQDIDDDGWADMSGYRRVVVRPRIFTDAENRSMFVTAGYTGEDREGGTVAGRVAPDGQPHPEGLETGRADVGLTARFLRGANVFSLRASGTDQRHEHVFGTVTERDVHRTTFGEASVAVPRGRWTAVLGGTFQREGYRSRDVSRFDFTYNVPSVFGQFDWDATQALVFSVSVRADWHNVYGTLVSPRLSALLRVPTSAELGRWTARLSGGRGSFAPVPFTEETDATGLSGLAPMNGLKAEKAWSSSFDLNGSFERPFGEVELNASAFGSLLDDPIAVVTCCDLGSYSRKIINSYGQTRTWGTEVLARLVSGALRLTGSYAHLRTSEFVPDPNYPQRHDVPLSPRHSAGLVGSIEHEGVSRLGLEVYYVGRQLLDDNPYRNESPPYVIVGLLAERQLETSWGRARLFINAENIGNVRQTRYDPLVRPTPGPGGRWTTDAWTELSGATVNGGVRIIF